MDERTLVILKPDAVYRSISGEIISRIEKAGFKISALKLIKISDRQAEEHYKEHYKKEYYERLMNFIKSGPVIVMVLEGPDVIEKIRSMVGKTVSTERKPGSIRGDLSVNNLYNLVHASDSKESSDREIKIFFGKNEILDFEIASQKYWYF
ncbi:MAG: nucleoside-diphosphate kinase [Candidatus Muiribacteriota bacterium]